MNDGGMEIRPVALTAGCEDFLRFDDLVGDIIVVVSSWYKTRLSNNSTSLLCIPAPFPCASTSKMSKTTSLCCDKAMLA